MRAILASSMAASSFAAWYSAFSLRSPHSRAIPIRSAISRRPWPSSASMSARSFSCAAAVILVVSPADIGMSLEAVGAWFGERLEEHLVGRTRLPVGGQQAGVPERVARRGAPVVDVHALQPGGDACEAGR